MKNSYWADFTAGLSGIPIPVSSRFGLHPGLPPSLVPVLAPRKEKAIGSTQMSSSTLLTMIQSGSEWSALASTRLSENLAKAYKKSPALRRAISVITQSLAGTPMFLKKRRSTPHGTPPYAEHGGSGMMGGAVREFGCTIPKHILLSPNAGFREKSLHSMDSDYENVYEHPFLSFLAEGSPLLSGSAGLLASYAYKELKGEFFWHLHRRKKGSLPFGWTVLPPQWVVELPNKDNKFTYGVRVDNITEHIPAEDVFWSRDPDLTILYGRGAGIAESAADEIDTDEGVANLLRQLIANKGYMDLMIAIKEADEATIREVDARYNKDRRGILSAGRALVFDAAGVEITPVTHPLSELKLLDLRDFEHRLISQVFGIPSELLGDVENRTRATIEGAERVLAKYALIPRLEAFRLDLQRSLLPIWDPKGEYLLSYVSPLVEDRDLVFSIMKEQPQAFTYNEWRCAAGYGNVPWGETRAVEFAIVELDTVHNERKKMAPESEEMTPKQPDAVKTEDMGDDMGAGQGKGGEG